jgi:aminoglycoside phosphotransferase (APT) family kinase protein
MSQPPQRDMDLAKRQLAGWLAKQLPDATGMRVTHLEKPGGSGFSNDTLLMDIAYQQGGAAREENLVVRVTPTGYPVFPYYDIGHQFDIMKAVGQKSDIPVPTMRWREEDKSLLGESFYVMERVYGSIPADNPPYPTEGFVFDATPAQREKMWWSGLDALMRIGTLDVDSLGLDFLEMPTLGSTPIEQHLAYYRRYLDWAREGEEQPTSQAVLAWLEANLPTDEPRALCWGDARVGNQIFRDFEVVSVLDWEMAALGNPVCDLGWWLFVDLINMAGNGIPGMARPRLEGLPSHEETVARWEEVMGRKAEHLLFYQAFAGLRFACVMIRVMGQQAHYGTFPMEAKPILQRNNVVTQHLAQLLDLPVPE